MITPQLKEAISALLEHNLTTPELDEHIRQLTVTKRWLFVSREWTGYYFLDHTGEVYFYDSDESVSSVEINPQLRLHALVSAAEL